MMLGILVSDNATSDMEAHGIRIAQDNPSAALRLHDAFDSHLPLIARFPSMGRLVHAGTLREVRRTYVPGFPNHAIFYHVEPGRIVIARVLHMSMDRAESQL